MNDVSRREFVSGAVALTALVAVGCSSTDGDTEESASGRSESDSSATTQPRTDADARRRVVVVGSGLAGLTAALDLAEAGWDVVVLEARDRVGGRVHTLRAPFSDGLHAEGGGESIDDDHGDLLAMIKRFGLKTEQRPSDKEERGVVFAGGTRSLTTTYIAQQDGAVLSDYLRFSDALDALGEDLDPDHPDRAERAAELDRANLATFISDQRLLPAAEFLVRSEQRGEYNSEPENVSLLFVAQQSAAGMNSRDEGVESMRIAGGNSLLAEAMAAQLGSRLQLSAPVTAVTWTKDSVKVSVGSDRSFDAARLVIATPFMPLRSVRFTPSLPGDLAEAISTVSLGPAAKVATEYQRRFWMGPDGSGSGFILTDLPFGVGWESTDSSVRDVASAGVLAQFITGQAAVDAARMVDPDRIAQFGAQLDQVWSEGSSAKTGNAATVAWANEQYTGGGYAVWQPGQLSRFWEPIRTGVGPIRFAGEHTEARAGYMDSAVRSGHRVAAEIGSPPPR